MIDGPRGARLRIAVAAVSLIVCAAASAQAGLAPNLVLRRPSTAQIFFDYEGDGVGDRSMTLGRSGDTLLLADVDGDTLADVILFRKGIWKIDLRNDGVIDRQFTLGNATGDIPVAGDFLGTGLAGFGYYRSATGVWSLDRNGDGVVDSTFTFGGAAGDVPLVADFDGDGRADCAIYRAGTWLVDLGCDGSLDATYALGGQPGDIPVAADWNGDWKADIAIFRAGTWLIDYDNDGTIDQTLSFGAAGDRPLVGPVDPRASLFVRAGAGGAPDGTQAAPFATINAALAAAPPLTTIRIAAGSYAESIAFVNRSDLSFVGAGILATHLRGAGSSDAFVTTVSHRIVLRNLHVASSSARGISVRGSTVTLDHVSTAGNESHCVVAVGTPGSIANLTIKHSHIDGSRSGNGLRLEGGGLTAKVVRSTIDGNGTVLPVATTSGRGVEAFDNSALTLKQSSVSRNYFGGLLFTANSSAVVRGSTIDGNGQNGMYFELGSSGNIAGSALDGNGVLGARGGATGFNAIEVAIGWSGPEMLIKENSMRANTLNGVFVGGGTVTIANNDFYDNFLGMTIWSSAHVTAMGNAIAVAPGQAYSEGILVGGGPAVATLGGTAAGQQNAFANFVNEPAIHCAGQGETTLCPQGGNAFDNCNLPVQACHCP